jgi:hypothetical protein
MADSPVLYHKHDSWDAHVLEETMAAAYDLWRKRGAEACTDG